MHFRTLKGCRRSPAEQRFVWAALEVWNKLPADRREAVRQLIGELAETPLEGRALYDVLVRGCTPQAVCARTGVQLGRLYKLRCAFYDRFRL